VNYVVADMMSNYGGRFERALSDAWYAGKDSSRAILEAAFPELFARYERMGIEKYTQPPHGCIAEADCVFQPHCGIDVTCYLQNPKALCDKFALFEAEVARLGAALKLARADEGER